MAAIEDCQEFGVVWQLRIQLSKIAIGDRATLLPIEIDRNKTVFCVVDLSINTVAWDLHSVAAIIEDAFGLRDTILVDFQKPAKALQNCFAGCSFVHDDPNVRRSESIFLKQ